MEISQYAPVLIPTLNRDVHFKRCVESLSKCTHAEKTDLFIALDYPIKDEHWDGYRKIKEFLKTLNGFKTIEIIERDKNFGAYKNFEQAMEYIFSKSDRIIPSEDDNEFSPNFLDYINKGLDKFEDDPKVLAVCGYNYPVIMPNKYVHNYYVNKAFSAWGYATWKNRKETITKNYDSDSLTKCMKNLNYIINSLIHYNLSQISNTLLAIKNEELRYGDMAITTTLLNENKICVFPIISKIRNHGNDGSGVHCKTNIPIYKNQVIDNQKLFEYSDKNIDINNKIVKVIKNHISYGWIKSLKNILMILK